MAEQLVPILSRRRDLGQVLQKLQHVVPAGALLFQGVSRLQHDRHGWSLLLAVAEIVVSVLVVGAFLRQVHAARSTHGVDHHGTHASHGVDWVDLLIAVMLGVEVWAHWYESGHIKRPTVVMAIGIFIVALMHGRIAAGARKRRSLKIDDAGVSVGGKPFRTFTATWDQLAAVEIEPLRARLIRKDGKAREFDFGDLRNAAAVREALQGVQLRLPVAEPGLADAGVTPPA